MSITDIVKYKLDNLVEPELSKTILDLRTLLDNYLYTRTLQDKTDRLQSCIEMCAFITDLAPLVELICYDFCSTVYKYGSIQIDIYKTQHQYTIYINSVIICEDIKSNSFKNMENFKLVVDLEYLQTLAEKIDMPIEKLVYLLYFLVNFE